MSYAKFFPIIIILIIALVGLGIWQGKSKQTANISSNSQNTVQTNNQNTNTSSFIEQLRQREFAGGEIKIEETLAHNNSYTSYIFSYPSNNLKIYGMMNIPEGDSRCFFSQFILSNSLV